MRIQSLNLLAFGQFTEKNIDLSSGTEGLHIIYGANESGKSTALRALKQALYGIPAKSADDFLHSYPDLRIGLVLKHSDGTLLKVIRRKGNTKTLRNFEKETEIVEEALLQKFLGNTGAAMFETMFGINHDCLVAGGQSIVTGTGEIGELLFSAGSGIADLRKVDEKLCRDYEELFGRAASTRILNKTLTELSEQKKKLRESELSSSEWEKHSQELHLAERQKNEIDKKIFALDAQISKLQRIKESLPLIAERSVCQEALAPVVLAILLPEDFQEKSRKVIDDLLVARSIERQAQTKIAALHNDIKEISIPEGVLEQASVIDSLVQSAGSHIKAAIDRAGLLTDVAESQELAKRCLRALGLNDNLAQAEEYRLKVQDRARITELANERSGILQAASDSQKDRENLESRVKAAEERLSSMPEPKNPEPLIRTVRKVEQHGQLEESLRSESLKLKANISKFLVELKKLNIQEDKLENAEIKATLALYENIRPPAAELQEHYHLQFKELGSEISANRSRIEDCKAELQKYNSLLAQAEAEMAVPTEDNLSEARSLREQGWKLVLRSWKDGSTLENEAESYISNFDSQTDLQTAYEKAVLAADNIGDRLRREASRVANKANFINQVKQREFQLAELESQKIQLDTARVTLMSQWQDIWQNTGFKSTVISEAKSWFAQYEHTGKLAFDLRESYAALLNLKSLISALKTELSEMLAEYDVNMPTEANLSKLIDSAHNTIDKTSEKHKLREQLEHDIQNFSNDLRASKEREKSGKEALAVWNHNWAIALKPLSLTENKSPSEAISFINQLEEFFKHFEEARDCQGRTDAIDRDSEKFKSDVEELATRIAPDLLGHPPIQAINELSARSVRAREARSRLSVINKQLAEEQVILEDSKQKIESLSGQTTSLCKEAKVDSAEDLVKAAQDSNLRRKIEAEINSLNRQLVRLCPEQPLDIFIAESLSTEGSTLDLALSNLRSEKIDLSQKRESFILTIGRETKILEDMNGKATAAEIAERIQELQAQAGTTAEQYVRLKLASLILKQSIERYREKNQSPILKKASEIFSRLTLNSFAGLLEDTGDDGKAILRGIRSTTRKNVELSGMSEGTCDQLFLALRLASLSLYLSKEEAIPLVLDDILVNFDDARSVATLEVLAELSKQTQIILFTHHAHLLELARTRLKDDQLFIHHLKEEQKQLSLT